MSCIYVLNADFFLFFYIGKPLKCWKYRQQSWHQSAGMETSVRFLTKPGLVEWFRFLLPEMINNRTAELSRSSGKIQPAVFNKRLTQTADASPCQLPSGLPNSWLGLYETHTHTQKWVCDNNDLSSFSDWRALLFLLTGGQGEERRGTPATGASVCTEPRLRHDKAKKKKKV